MRLLATCTSSASTLHEARASWWSLWPHRKPPGSQRHLVKRVETQPMRRIRVRQSPGGPATSSCTYSKRLRVRASTLRAYCVAYLACTCILGAHVDLLYHVTTRSGDSTLLDTRLSGLKMSSVEPPDNDMPTTRSSALPPQPSPDSRRVAASASYWQRAGDSAGMGGGCVRGVVWVRHKAPS